MAADRQQRQRGVPRLRVRRHHHRDRDDDDVRQVAGGGDLQDPETARQTGEREAAVGAAHGGEVTRGRELHGLRSADRVRANPRLGDGTAAFDLHQALNAEGFRRRLLRDGRAARCDRSGREPGTRQRARELRHRPDDRPWRAPVQGEKALLFSGPRAIAPGPLFRAGLLGRCRAHLRSRLDADARARDGPHRRGRHDRARGVHGRPRRGRRARRPHRAAVDPHAGPAGVRRSGDRHRRLRARVAAGDPVAGCAAGLGVPRWRRRLHLRRHPSRGRARRRDGARDRDGRDAPAGGAMARDVGGGRRIVCRTALRREHRRRGAGRGHDRLRPAPCLRHRDDDLDRHRAQRRRGGDGGHTGPAPASGHDDGRIEDRASPRQRVRHRRATGSRRPRPSLPAAPRRWRCSSSGRGSWRSPSGRRRSRSRRW